MKLINKDDGRVKEFGIDETKVQPYYLRDELGNICWYKTLSEVTKYWEDVPEEPKDFWFIDADGEARETTHLSNNDKSSLRNFGNYFSSQEEAELAVRKLKAWKRLKDKGFEFTGFTHKDRGRLDELEIYCYLGKRPEDIEDMGDVGLLFGGEE